MSVSLKDSREGWQPPRTMPNGLRWNHVEPIFCQILPVWHERTSKDIDQIWCIRFCTQLHCDLERILENSHVSRCPFVATLLWAIPCWTQCQDGLPMADGFHEIWDVRAREKALTSSVDDKEHEFPGLICLPRPIASSYLTFADFAVISAVQKSGNTPNSFFVSDQMAILRSTSYFYLCKRKHRCKSAQELGEIRRVRRATFSYRRMLSAESPAARKSPFAYASTPKPSFWCEKIELSWWFWVKSKRSWVLGEVPRPKGRGRAVWACPLPPDLGENQLG